MTIISIIKVNNGIVVASDTAITMAAPDDGVAQIYDGMTKIFDLSDRLPVGIAFFGTATIGKMSINNVIGELKQEMGDSGSLTFLDIDNYTVEEIANSLIKKIDSLISFEKQKNASFSYDCGIYVFGYDSNAKYPVLWGITVANSICTEFVLHRDMDSCGENYGGSVELISRIVFGNRSVVEAILKKYVSDPATVQEALEEYSDASCITFVKDNMPIKNAIDLARFYVDTTIKYSEHMHAIRVVGGKIDVASVTRFDGFKWHSRAN